MSSPHDDDYPSDDDLSFGLPSPDVSDEEDIQCSDDFGWIVPHYCNKLRKLTQPLFPKEAPVTASDLINEDDDSEKTEVKKNSATDEGDVSRKSASHSGYVASPRWTKSPSMRPYEPSDITGGDESAIAGVVFRNSSATKSGTFQSSRDSDFPSLNESNQSDIFDMSKSTTDASIGYSGPLSVSQEAKLKKSPCISRLLHSPITSTPTHQKRRSIVPQESPIIITRTDNQCQVSPRPNEPPHNHQMSQLVTGCSSRSGSKNSRRRSKKSLQNSMDKSRSPAPGGGGDFNDNNNADSTDGARNPLGLEENVINNNDNNNNNNNICSSSQSKNDCSMKYTGAQTDRNSSPIFPVPHSKCDMMNERPQSKWNSKGSSHRNSPTNRMPQYSNEVFVDTRAKACDSKSASPTWSNIAAKTSPCLSPATVRVDSPTMGRCYPHNQPRTPGKQQPQAMENRRKITLDDSSEDGKRDCVVGGQKAATNGRRQRVQLVPVDSCATPSKKAGNDPWAAKSNADISAFENRFVEKIAISTTSPPKKVNPSPIKKLDFFQKNSDGSFGGGVDKESSLLRRQVSLISDLDWKRSATSEHSNRSSKGAKAGSKEKTAKSRRSMFSLEDYVKTHEVVKVKDEISQEYINENKGTGVDATKMKVDQFWAPKRVVDADDGSPTNTSGMVLEVVGPASSSTQSMVPPPLVKHTATHGAVRLLADVKEVTFKVCLRKHARRYCHFVEGHLVTNISREILFILQLLTCSDAEPRPVKDKDVKASSNPFGSTHNCVYFAVLVIKRLKRLFSCLSKPTLCLLAANPRVKDFSPKLNEFFKGCLASKKFIGKTLETFTYNPLDVSTLGSYHDWSNSFSDTKMAHVFKCQRDNFHALYQRYQDADAGHPFHMEEQIHYVYDRQIAEHNCVVSRMHLAQLFVDLLLQFSAKHFYDQATFLDLLAAGDGTNQDGCCKEFEEWKQANSWCTFGSPPRWNKTELFFQAFVQAMRCPAFNEMLKNTMAAKMLEMNGTDLGFLKTLHSVSCLPDDETPHRCESFTSTVLSLCILGKMLGHLVFDPYCGDEDLSSAESHHMIIMRELVPLALPLPRLLTEACASGRLCLTVPWVVQFLSTMDGLAPKLAAYSQTIAQLSSIHRYSWVKLYNRGHHNTGLLLTSCISWLFENPALSPGLVSSHRAESIDGPESPQCHSQTKCLDTQRVVTSQLLFSCCPFLDAGHIPLALFASRHHTVSVGTMRQVMTLNPLCDHAVIAPSSTQTPRGEGGGRDWTGLGRCLASSRHTQTAAGDWHSERTDSRRQASPQGHPTTVPPSMWTSKGRQDNDSLCELTSSFLRGHPYLNHCLQRGVELMVGKVHDYALNTILKLGVFEARVKVRRKFMKMDSGQDADSVKSSILANSNITASKLSQGSKRAFVQIGDKVCETELPHLIDFLASHVEEPVRVAAIGVAQKAAASQLVEWATLQLGADVFRRVIVHEADKVASTWSFKPCSLYPSDYLRKPEYSNLVPKLPSGFDHLHQLSHILDTALACGSWYMNGQTRGPRPDDVFLLSLMEELMACFQHHNVSLDFSFPIAINFLMHLIIQYIVDAPHHWTEACVETFIALCRRFEAKKCQDERLSFQPLDPLHKTKKMTMKVTSLMSIFSLDWLARSADLDHSLMVYCGSLARLVEAGLVSVEKAMATLTTARASPHVTTTTGLMIDRVMVKVLELLYTSTTTTGGGGQCDHDEEEGGSSQGRVVALVPGLLDHLKACGSDKALTHLRLVFPHRDRQI